MSSNTTQYVAVSGEQELSSGVGVAGRCRAGVTRSLGKYLTRDILSTVATSFVLFGFMTLQGIFLARMLGPEGRGQYATAVFYTQTFIYIGLLGTQHAIARWAARRQNDGPALVQTTRRLGLLTGFCTMAVVALLAFFALPTEKQYLAPLCLLCSMFLPFEHVRLLWLSVDHGRGDFRRYNWSRLAAGIAFPALLGIAWASGANTATIVALLFVVSPLVGLFYQRASRTTASISALSRTAPTMKRILQRGRPYALAVMVSDLCDRLDVFLFLWLASFTAQGYYAAAVPAANLLLVVPIALSLFAFNAGARRERRARPASILKTSAIILSVQLFAAAAFAVVLEPLMVLVFGEDFRGAVPLTLALLPAYAIAGCGRIAESFLQGRNKAIIGVYTRLLGAGVMGVFIYFAFDRWAELSIPLGALAGYTVSTTILLLAILRDARGISAPRDFTAEGTVP
ncbi:MAG: oligosaccharide flippase family protein [Bythopirellula sp.]|nr:oligosaccharide flippase family protein [Bythopirellula sp.]